MMPGALAIVMVTLWVRRGSSDAVGTKPAILGGRRAMEYCYSLICFRLGDKPKADFYKEGKKEINLPSKQIAETRMTASSPLGRKVLLAESACQGRPPLPPPNPHPRPWERCQYRAARTQHLPRSKQTCCCSFVRRTHQRLASQGRRSVGGTNWERWRTCRALANPCRGG
jgi:hypothetical protein